MSNNEKIAYLKKYRACLALEHDLCGEIEELRSRAEKITPSFTGMPCGGGGTDAAFVLCVEQMDLKRMHLCEEMQRSAQIRESICNTICAINDATLCRVLYLRYISGFTWERIAVEMNYGYRHVCRMHGRALAKLKMS